MGMTDQNPPMPTGPEIQRLVLRALHALGGRAHRQTITRKAIELGGFTREQLAVPPPPKNTGRFGNKIKFMVSIALSTLKKKGLITNVGDGDWILVEPR